MTFRSIQGELSGLLREFGPHRKVIHPEHPFWLMQKDEVWEIDRPELVAQTSWGDARPTSLLEHNIQGGFPEPIYESFRKYPEFAMSVANMLLHSHFPATLHSDILRASGIASDLPGIEPLGVREELPEYVTYRRLKREEGFRNAVLAAYDNQCAVCEFSVKLDGYPLALEAAHIKWHGAKGPAETRNGLSLCALHHRLFDKGVFTLLPDELKIIVDEAVSSGDPGFHDSLGKFHEKPLHFIPHKFEERPSPEFIKWHVKQVFKSPNQIPDTF